MPSPKNGDDGLVLEFEINGTPKTRFCRVEDPNCRTIRFQIYDTANLDWQLVIERVSSPCNKEIRQQFEKNGFRHYATIKIVESGTYRYYLERPTRYCSFSAYLQIAGKIAVNLYPSDVRLQTLLTKWTKPAEFIKRLLPSIKSTGYNMIHLVPVQERGLSDSPFSIRDQLALSSDFDDPNSGSLPNTQAMRKKTLHNMIAACHNENISVMVDVVWNHTACDSSWLIDHPEVGYTLQTAPYLKAAWELDEAMLMFSMEIGNRDDGSNLGKIENEADLDSVMAEFKLKVDQLELQQYFLLDIDAHLRAFNSNSGSKNAVPEKEAFRVYFDGMHDRFSYSLSMDSVNSYYRSNSNITDKRADLRNRLEEINAQRFREIYEEIYNAILNNTRTRVRYERLASDGPKLGPITSSTPLLSPYFTRVFPPNCNTPLAFANNGWVWDADPLVNFAESPGLAYLKRDIIIWGDCVKLRYGETVEESPWLWQHMIQYTQEMASMFDAVRIDNCHSTPLPVARRLIAEARRVNPDIYIIAELFTGRPDRDVLFVGELGIDSLIREAMACNDPADLANSITRFSTFKISTQPHALLMDCTHDNPSPAQKRTAIDALPNAALVAMSPCAVGSVRGYDQLCPEHLNIVSEQRLYGINGECPIEKFKELIYHLRKLWDVQVTETEGLITIRAISDDKEYILHAKTSFVQSDHVNHVKSEGHVLFSGRLTIDPEYKADAERITGYKGTLENLQSIQDGFSEMHPGSVLLLEMPINNTNHVMQAINAYYANETNWTFLHSLSLEDFNMLLYRTDAEERDMDPACGVYIVPDYGPLPYCGIAGFHLALEKIKHAAFLHSDPFTINVRLGNWMLDYTLGRLISRSFNSHVIASLRTLFNLIKDLDRKDRPREVFRAFHFLYDTCTSILRKRLNAKDDLEFMLAIGLVQMYGIVGSTGVHPEIPSASLSAGLPHFTTHHMRSWGRDTFISYPGFFIISGQLEEGAKLLCAFASCLFNGLIPNLLDAARFPRFNCRDAVWWFCYALLRHAKRDIKIFDHIVRMRFPENIYVDYKVWLEQGPIAQMTMREILIEIFTSHARGINFTEHNAGPSLDAHMTDNGFKMSIYVDWSTGLVHGGNSFNCGTWMDKMGSVSGVNAGVPSTPRDGAAIEINALCCYSLNAFLELCGDVQLSETQSVSSWCNLLKTNFDKAFFSTQLGYYKDTVGSSDLDADELLRPNFLVATCLLHDTLDPEYVRLSIEKAGSELLGAKSIGMRTLGSSSPGYKPTYDLNDGTGGANYHNGPEWPWLTGFYIRSYLFQFKDIRPISSLLDRIHVHLLESQMGGVTELTNADGQHCPHACPTQAWSMACLREAVHYHNNKN